MIGKNLKDIMKFEHKKSVTSLEDKMQSFSGMPFHVESYEEYRDLADKEISTWGLDLSKVEEKDFLMNTFTCDETPFETEGKEHYLFQDRPLLRAYHVKYLYEKLGLEYFRHNTIRAMLDQMMALAMVFEDLHKIVKSMISGDESSRFLVIMNKGVFTQSRKLQMYNDQYLCKDFALGDSIDLMKSLGIEMDTKKYCEGVREYMAMDLEFNYKVYDLIKENSFLNGCED